MKKGTERREGKRAEVEIDVDLGAYGKYDLSQLTNVSIGGAFVLTRNLQPIGTPVKLKFQLPGEKAKIEVSGEVTWVYDQAGKREHNSTGLGVKFTKIDPKDQQKIAHYIRAANTDDKTPIA